MTAHARFGIMRVRRVSVGHRAFAECFLPCIRSLLFDSKRTSLYMYITDDVSHPGISPLNAFLHQNLELRAISISPILSRGFESWCQFPPSAFALDHPMVEWRHKASRGHRGTWCRYLACNRLLVHYRCSKWLDSRQPVFSFRAESICLCNPRMTYPQHMSRHRPKERERKFYHPWSSYATRKSCRRWRIH